MRVREGAQEALAWWMGSGCSYPFGAEERLSSAAEVGALGSAGRGPLPPAPG